jgi:hypothetical protein
MRVDWFRLMVEICGRGHSIYSIADAIDVPRTTVMNWRAGAEPKYSDGAALMELWRQTMSSPPMIDGTVRNRQTRK